MNNKILGNNFEKEFAEILSKEGYWVTFLTPKKNIGSQPCDLIAIKNGVPLLIDCKTCATYTFPLKRIEENQRQAYRIYKKFNPDATFILAIKYKDEIYIQDMDFIDFSKNSFNILDCKKWEVK